MTVSNALVRSTKVYSLLLMLLSLAHASKLPISMHIRIVYLSVVYLQAKVTVKVTN